MKFWLGMLFGSCIATAICVGLSHRENRPYQHLLTTVERVDEPEDALRVYHDRVRGVTCYAMLNDDRGINCLADSWLTPRTDASR